MSLFESEMLKLPVRLINLPGRYVIKTAPSFDLLEGSPFGEVQLKPYLKSEESFAVRSASNEPFIT
jgi:hypothetical protein